MAVDDVTQPTASRAGADSPPDVNLISRLMMGLLQILPFVFGLGFVAPLIAQLLKRALPEAAHAQWPLLAGLVIGGSWGALANLRGRWI